MSTSCRDYVRTHFCWWPILLVLCGCTASPFLERLLPLRGEYENLALIEKGAMAMASQTYDWNTDTIADSVYAWKGMPDHLSPFHDAVHSIIDGDLSQDRYWASYEMRRSVTQEGERGTYLTVRPNHIDILFPCEVQLSRILVHTSQEATAIRARHVGLESYTLKYFNDAVSSGEWVTIESVSGNESTVRVHDFPPVYTRKIRLELIQTDYWRAVGWVKDERTGSERFKVPKVTEIEAYGIRLPSSKMQDQKPPGKFSVFAASAEDSQGDVLDHETGKATAGHPELDIVNARVYVQGDDLILNMAVAGYLVGEDVDTTEVYCTYGFRIDVDADSTYDLECTYLAPAKSIEGKVVDTEGTKHRLRYGIEASTSLRKSLTLRIPIALIDEIRQLEVCQFEAFTETVRYTDVCVSPKATSR